MCAQYGLISYFLLPNLKHDPKLIDQADADSRVQKQAERNSLNSP